MTNADIAAAADGALYQAKGSGKDRIMVWLAKH
jgi:PleD family two-component response regulator